MTVHSKKILGVVAAILFITALYFTFTKKAEAPASDAQSMSKSSPQIAIDPVKPNATAQQGGYTITTTKKEQINAPSLSTPIVYDSKLSASNRTALEKKIAEQRQYMQSHLNDANAWINLGIMYKMTGDYQAAKTVWEYVNVAAPQQSTSFHNLGDLYEFYLKDYPKADANYLKALSINSTMIMDYLALHEMYRDLYHKSNTAAEDILKQGIAANPDSIDLYLALARYYKASGREADATSQFKIALEKAGNNADVANAIKQEAGL